MPTDENGNRFDLIFDGISTFRRTNFGRFIEHHLGAVCIELEQELKQLVEQGQTEQALERLFHLYYVVSPLMYEKSNEILKTPELKLQHLHEVLEEGIQIWLPQNSPQPMDRMMERVLAEFPVHDTPVTYTDLEGRKFKTVKPVLYGSLYILTLEKIGDDWGATSVPKRQHHGMPSKLTDYDKHLLPWRSQAFKIFGESEVRLLLGTLNSSFVSSLLTLSNSPEMSMEFAKAILRAKYPTSMTTAVDYRKHAEKPGRPLQYFNHILAMSGVRVIQGDPNK